MNDKPIELECECGAKSEVQTLEEFQKWLDEHQGHTGSMKVKETVH